MRAGILFVQRGSGETRSNLLCSEIIFEGLLKKLEVFCHVRDFYIHEKLVFLLQTTSFKKLPLKTFDKWRRGEKELARCELVRVVRIKSMWWESNLIRWDILVSTATHLRTCLLFVDRRLGNGFCNK